MDEWVAIDFETANEQRGSPCAVALVAVKDGAVVDSETFYIRPPVFYFSPLNVALHGITPEMCLEASDWPTALARIVDFAANRPLVAHYAAFDSGVIRDACETNLPWPEFRYACTLVIGRQTWPGLVSYSLPYVAAACGAAEWDHHDPSGDAFAAAQIAIAAMREHRVQSLAALLEATRARWGEITSDHWRGCQRGNTPPVLPTTSSVLPTASPGAVFDETNVLFGKTVVFTGELVMVRREVQQMVVDIGGHVAANVSKNVDFLVTGYQDITRLAAGQIKSSKYRKAEQLRAAGHPIEIMSEVDFYRTIRSTLATQGQRQPAIPPQRAGRHHAAMAELGRPGRTSAGTGELVKGSSSAAARHSLAKSP